MDPSEGALMDAAGIVFYGIAAVVVLTSLAVVTLKNIFYSAVALTAALTAVAGLFFLLGADFLGAAQILVYVGGIMIIMLFVIMLSHQVRDKLQPQTNEQWIWGFFASILIGTALIKGFKPLLTQSASVRELVPTSAAIGRMLLGEFLLPFEAVSLVLLAALIGAVLFGQDKT